MKKCYTIIMSSSRELERKYQSPTHYILKGLIPYTEANIKLSFKPNQFFDDLEKLDAIKAKKKSIKTSYYRAIKKGLVEFDDDGYPRLTSKGERKIKIFKPKKLAKDARILLTFDVPEEKKRKRERLRAVLREFKFKQVQKSVWETEYDVLKFLEAEIKDNQLENYINIYESIKIR